MLEKDKNLLEKVIYYCKLTSEISDKHGKSFEEYVNNNEMQLSLDMCLFQIGELSSRISDAIKQQHKDIPWVEIKGLRNIEAHEYENKDYNIVWKTICRDVPDLQSKLLDILKESN